MKAIVDHPRWFWLTIRSYLVGGGGGGGGGARQPPHPQFVQLEAAPPATVSSSLSVSTLVAAVLIALVIDTSPFDQQTDPFHRWRGHRGRGSCEAVHRRPLNQTFRDGHHAERPSRACVSVSRARAARVRIRRVRPHQEKTPDFAGPGLTVGRKFAQLNTKE